MVGVAHKILEREQKGKQSQTQNRRKDHRLSDIQISDGREDRPDNANGHRALAGQPRDAHSKARPVNAIAFRLVRIIHWRSGAHDLAKAEQHQTAEHMNGQRQDGDRCFTPFIDIADPCDQDIER